MITIKLPTQLRSLTGGKSTLNVEGDTFAQVLTHLEQIAPMLPSQVFDTNGTVRPFIGVFVNGEQISSIAEANSAVCKGAQVSIITAVAGG